MRIDAYDHPWHGLVKTENTTHVTVTASIVVGWLNLVQAVVFLAICILEC